MPGNHFAFQGLPIHYTDPGHSERSRLDRDAASLPEQIVTVSYPDSQSGNLTEHGIDSIQMLNPDICLLTLGDIRDDASGPIGLPGIVQNRSASSVDPTHLAVEAHDAKLRIKLRFIGLGEM